MYLEAEARKIQKDKKEWIGRLLQDTFRSRYILLQSFFKTFWKIDNSETQICIFCRLWRSCSDSRKSMSLTTQKQKQVIHQVSQTCFSTFRKAINCCNSNYFFNFIICTRVIHKHSKKRVKLMNNSVHSTITVFTTIWQRRLLQYGHRVYWSHLWFLSVVALRHAILFSLTLLGCSTFFCYNKKFAKSSSNSGGHQLTYFISVS